jgi:DNA-binding NtrC family response regulator
MSFFPRIQVVPLAEVPTSDVSAETMKHQKPLALIVDDEHIIADTLSIILQRNGFNTITAYDGASALEAASATSPDLLLSDVMMGPGIDGAELAMQVVRAHPDCKVLLFSGHSATRDLLSKVREAGHNFTLLAKPLHPADLLERLGQTFQLRQTDCSGVQSSASPACG